MLPVHPEEFCGLLQRHHCIERTQAARGRLLRLMMIGLLGPEAPTLAMMRTPPPCLTPLLPLGLRQTRQPPLSQVLTEACASLLQSIAHSSDMPDT